MPINVDQYIITHRQMPHFTEEVALSVGDYGDDIYNIKWGEGQKAVRHGIIESGFLWDGLHFDTLGLYQFSSLNLPAMSEIIYSYRPRASALEISQMAPQPSKFAQPREDVQWDGVVLACQNPTDRSILMGAHERDYWSFVEEACRTYRERLFLKLHPWNNGEIEARFRETAACYGCQAEKVNHSVLEKCQFCLVYNSTFAFDCFIRGVPVVQFAPGYFWQTGAVYYTCRSLVSDHGDTVDEAYRLANWVVWNYMIHCKMGGDEWAAFLKRMYDLKDTMFPLVQAQEFSYAQQMINRSQPG